jgi:hypothetical protein
MAIPDQVVTTHKDYKTWDVFKRDLETKIGRWLTVDLWLRAKPKKALPWNDIDMQTSLSEVLRILKEDGYASRVDKIWIKH